MSIDSLRFFLECNPDFRPSFSSGFYLFKAFSRLSGLSFSINLFRVFEISYTRSDLERLVRDSKPYTSYELGFLSPTCFRRLCPYILLHTMGLMDGVMRLMGKPRSHYQSLPLPDHILMLRDLKRQWDHYAGLSLRAHKLTGGWGGNAGWGE